jgi:hypothetical protein
MHTLHRFIPENPSPSLLKNSLNSIIHTDVIHLKKRLDCAKIQCTKEGYRKSEVKSSAETVEVRFPTQRDLNDQDF